MEDKLDSPRVRRSLRSRGAPESPQVSPSPSNVTKKGAKKSPASQLKTENDKAKDTNDTPGVDSSKAVKEVKNSVEGICKVVKDVQNSSKEGVEGGANSDRDMYGVHEEVMLEENIKDEVGSDDGKGSTSNDNDNAVENICENLEDAVDKEPAAYLDVPDAEKVREEEEPCDNSTLLNDTGTEDLQTVPPPFPSNVLKEKESVQAIVIPDEGIDKENESVPSIVIPDEVIDDDITLIYEDEPPKFKRSSSNTDAEFIELDRVGQVDDTGNDDDDVVTIVDEDEDVLQELEAIRSVGRQGSERGDSILNTTIESSGAVSLIDFGDDYGFSDEEIELSGDEENYERGDVTMMLIKRPPLRTVTVECYDILDSDEEFPVCVAQGEKKDAVNIEEKRGEIKEYIEKEGLGIIFSKEFGLILFHLENVWINGDKFIAARTRQKLPVGSAVCFYDQSFEGDEFKSLSSDGIIHQAVAVWVGQRVEHLLKKISEPVYIRKLAQNRESFMQYLNNDVFMRVALVRAKAQVMGYINDQVGILGLKEGGAHKNVLFHTDNVLVFKKPLSMYYQMSVIQNGYCTTTAKQLLPIGLNVSIDARKIHMNGMRDIEYQAIWVLAGTWPHSIHPTLLPGGAGSVYPTSYQVPDDHTFYYCDIELEARLQRKVHNFYDILATTRGQVNYDDRGTIRIKGPQDHADWKSQFTGRKQPPNNKKKMNRNGEKEEVSHLFKAPPPRPPIVPKEVKEEDESVAATAGSSCGGSVSGVGSAFSRPWSRMSMSSHSSGISRTSSHQTRNWYSRDVWGLGGLRIKPEVKSELEDEDGPSPPKRMKAELGV